MKKTAIILGATGLTGGLLLKKLLADDSYHQIKLISRKSCGLSNPKIVEFLGDVISLENFKKDFTANEVFCCIGTTKSKTKSNKVYRSIDLGIPTKAAKLCKKNNIPFFAVVSAIGANSKSIFSFNRMKGEMENAILNENLNFTYILRPSLINGKRNEKRFVEDIGNIFFSFFNFFLVGSLKNYQSIKAETIAKALHKLPKIKPFNKIILSEEIKDISKNI